MVLNKKPKNLAFLQYDENFLSLVKEQRKKAGEKSVLSELDKVLEKHNIKLVDQCFLTSYLTQYKCPELNVDLLDLFNKATYLNEKAGILQDLLANNYDKDKYKSIITTELSKKYSEFSNIEIEDYKYTLNDYLRQLKRRK